MHCYILKMRFTLIECYYRRTWFTLLLCNYTTTLDHSIRMVHSLYTARSCFMLLSSPSLILHLWYYPASRFIPPLRNYRLERFYSFGYPPSDQSASMLLTNNLFQSHILKLSLLSLHSCIMLLSLQPIHSPSMLLSMLVVRDPLLALMV